MVRKKRRVIFRIFQGNRLTMPLLLNIWEKNGLDRCFDIVLAEALPGHLARLADNAGVPGDVFIYSFMTPHLPWVAEEINALRARGGVPPLFAAGGPHVSGERELVRACGFHVLFTGPGENTFVEFGRDLLSGKITANDGILYDGRKGMASLPDSLPADSSWQRYIPVSRYFKTVPPLEITRGCYWHCRYCQTGGERPSHRSLESVTEYLAALRRRRLPRVGFISPSALEFASDRRSRPNLERLGALLQLCKTEGFRFIEYGIFPSELRPDAVNAEVLNLLRRFVSNRSLTFGAQSASEARLKAIGRGHRLADIENALHLANEAGFSANLDFIIALPGETSDDRRELLALMKRLGKKYRVRFQLHHFFPLAGSPYARRFPQFLEDAERQAFIELKKNGSASDWWLAGEKSAREYFFWLQKYFPDFWRKYH